jgi:hypothetical protein
LRHRVWFWGTLAFWLTLGTAGISRALLWGPPNLARDPKGSFQGELNGLPIQAETWTALGPMEEGLEALEREWSSDGWRPYGNGEDWFAPLLASDEIDSEGQELLQRLLRLHLFQKGKTLRLLGLLKDGESALSGIILDLPTDALASAPGNSTDIDTPAQAPDNASVTRLSTGRFHLALWRFGSSGRSSPSPLDWCRDHSIALRPLGAATTKMDFIATSRDKSWLLHVEPSPHGAIWVWTGLPSFP